jgi:hypothetical protein
MAIEDQEPTKIYTPLTMEPAMEPLRRPLMPAVRWGAILAGVAAGVSVQLVLTLFGIATGLSVSDVAQDNGGAAMGALLWAGASMLVAAFVGGYVAGRMSGLKRKTDGVLHGLVSWAVTTLLFATVAASASGSILGGIFHTLGPGVMQSATRGGAQVNDMLGAQAGRIDVNSLQQLQQHIQAGRRDEAIELLVNSMGMNPERAAGVVDQAMILAGSADSASPDARAATDQAVDSAGTMAWILFAAVALALAIGIAGGVVGAVGSRRTTWSTNSLTSTA